MDSCQMKIYVSFSKSHHLMKKHYVVLGYCVFKKLRGTLPDKYEDKSKSKGYIVYELAQSSFVKFQTSPR